jgi:hypothetical protein
MAVGYSLKGGDADAYHIPYWNVLSYGPHPQTEETLKPPLQSSGGFIGWSELTSI